MKGDNISVRLRRFAAGVIRLCRRLPHDAAATHVARQLLRSATGGGANYEEARGAESRPDFVHKLGVANKEVREALYWLQLVREAELLLRDTELDTLAREADELVAILTSSINTARERDGSMRAREASASQKWRTGEPRTESGEFS